MQKMVSLVLIGVILNLTFYASSANGAMLNEDSAKRAEMVGNLKMELNKIGVGKESKLKLKLNDGTKISGYLAEINDEDFVVVPKDDESKRVRYSDVRHARGRHRYHRFSLTASLIGAALGVLLFALSGNSNRNY